MVSDKRKKIDHVILFMRKVVKRRNVWYISTIWATCDIVDLYDNKRQKIER